MKRDDNSGENVDNRLNIDQFPQETQDFIHQLCVNAIIRAIQNGTYVPLNNGDIYDIGSQNNKEK